MNGELSEGSSNEIAPAECFSGRGEIVRAGLAGQPFPCQSAEGAGSVFERRSGSSIGVT